MQSQDGSCRETSHLCSRRLCAQMRALFPVTPLGFDSGGFLISAGLVLSEAESTAAKTEMFYRYASSGAEKQNHRHERLFI